MSLYITGARQNLVNTLKDYNVDVAALQKIKWTETGQIKINDYGIYYKDLDDTHQFEQDSLHIKIFCPTIKNLIQYLNACVIYN